MAVTPFKAFCSWRAGPSRPRRRPMFRARSTRISTARRPRSRACRPSRSGAGRPKGDRLPRRMPRPQPPAEHRRLSRRRNGSRRRLPRRSAACRRPRSDAGTAAAGRAAELRRRARRRRRLDRRRRQGGARREGRDRSSARDVLGIAVAGADGDFADRARRSAEARRLPDRAARHRDPATSSPCRSRPPSCRFPKRRRPGAGPGRGARQAVRADHRSGARTPRRGSTASPSPGGGAGARRAPQAWIDARIASGCSVCC